MPRSPAVVVFDVNETLSDLTPMAERFAAAGAAPQLARLWFAALLRDGFALTVTGGYAEFAALADGALRGVLSGVLSGVAPEGGLDAAVEQVMAGFADLPVHPDVPAGVRVLRAAGLRLITLSNGSPDVADRLLSRAGLREHFESLLSVRDAGAWKPAGAPYAYAARSCGVEPADMLLVAVHPWDVHGAACAGFSTAWLNRSGGPYPAYFAAPDHTAASLTELAAALR